MKIFVVYCYGDFDAESVLGVASTFDKGIGLIKEDFENHSLKWDKSLSLIEIENEKGSFRKSNSDKSETDYFIVERKMDHLFLKS